MFSDLTSWISTSGAFIFPPIPLKNPLKPFLLSDKFKSISGKVIAGLFKFVSISSTFISIFLLFSISIFGLVIFISALVPFTFIFFVLLLSSSFMSMFNSVTAPLFLPVLHLKNLFIPHLSSSFVAFSFLLTSGPFMFIFKSLVGLLDSSAMISKLSSLITPPRD